MWSSFHSAVKVLFLFTAAGAVAHLGSKLQPSLLPFPFFLPNSFHSQDCQIDICSLRLRQRRRRRPYLVEVGEAETVSSSFFSGSHACSLAPAAGSVCSGWQLYAFRRKFGGGWQQSRFTWNESRRSISHKPLIIVKCKSQLILASHISN